MVTLKEAVELIQMNERENVYIRRDGAMSGFYYTRKEIQGQFDLEHTMVVQIQPSFVFHEYDCLELVIRDTKVSA